MLYKHAVRVQLSERNVPLVFGTAIFFGMNSTVITLSA